MHPASLLPGRTVPLAVRIAAAAVFLLPAPAVRAGFVDVTASASAAPAPGITYGLGWSDFDLDGDPDCFVCRHFERPVLYRNSGAGTLSHLEHPPLFDVALDHHGPLVADLDGDGDDDIYLTGGADAGFGDSEKKMYRNDGPDEDGRMIFVDVAAAWGLTDLLARGRSSSAADVDRDGDLDVFVAKASRVASPNSLFLQGPSGFTDVAAAAGLADDFGSVGGLFADYDSDGDPDLLIGGEEEVSFQTRLYRNNGNLTFTNVTAQALPGIGQIAAAAWGDADNDGDLDLAVGLGDGGLFDAVRWDADSLFYFMNTRYGDDGLDGIAFFQSGDSATYDVTQDGYFRPDSIFISESAYNPTLSPFTLSFQNFGAPPFFPGQTLATYIWTQQFAGDWELRCNAPPEAGHNFAGVITTNGDFTAVALVAPETYTHGPRGTRLWRNDGGTFVDVSAAAGLADTANVRFLQWADVDQDGRLDLYVEDKGDTQTLNGPNRFYRNAGGGTFVDATSAWNLAGPDRGLGDAFAFEDYDGDADLDVVILSGSGPRFLAGFEQVRLYRNDGPVGNRLRVSLAGEASTRKGHGAWVTCISATAGRQVRYVTGNTWRGGPTMTDPWFGLGPDAGADTLVVKWPSGVATVMTNVPAGVVTVPEVDATSEAPLAARPAALRLTARPNPTGGAVSLLAAGRDRRRPARLDVFDASGRRVMTRRLAPGAERLDWDGRDAQGRPAAPGVYFARLAEGDRRTEVKIVRLAR